MSILGHVVWNCCWSLGGLLACCYVPPVGAHVGFHPRDECCSARRSAQSADLCAAARASAPLWPRPESPRAERGSTVTPILLQLLNVDQAAFQRPGRLTR